MRLAASNIAWEPADDDAVAAMLRERGVTGVEIAPSKRWESPMDATKQEIIAYRDSWSARGFEVVAMQALLFGRADLQLFGSPAVRRALREYLIGLIEMAHGLGARALVFGSPKNRKRGRMPMAEATDIAVEFFRGVGAVAASRNCAICIEPNPPAYDCDFINTTAEAVSLCEQIASRGIRVNGDGGAIVMANDDAASVIRAAAPHFGHFHASEPNLALLTDSAFHRAASDALVESRYDRWVSIEMRAGQGASNIDSIARAADIARRVYGG